MGKYPVEEFLWGLAAGVVALALTAGLVAVAGRTHSGARRAPATGLLMAVAALLAITPSRTPTPGVLLGLAGVTAVAGLGARRRSPAGAASPLIGVLLAAPFAWLLAVDASSIGWVRAFVVGSTAVGAVAAGRTDAECVGTGLTPVLYVVTAGGVFAAVPNTQEAAALLGASVPGALAGWPFCRGRLGGAGAAAATALLVWIAAVGALGREPAVVGAVACVGLLATLPPGRWLAGRWVDRRVRPPRRIFACQLPVLVVHAVVVAVASRAAGVSHELMVAVPVSVAVTVGALVASTWLWADTTLALAATARPPGVIRR